MQKEKSERLIKLIAKGGIVIFAGSLIGKLLRFIFYVILIRGLGASFYGLYSIGQSTIDIFTNIAQLGDGRGMIKFAARYIHEKDNSRLKGVIISYLSVCFLISLIISSAIFVSAQYLSLRLFHNLALTGVLRIFSAGFPFYIFSLTCIPIGYAFHRMGYKVIIQEIAQPVLNIIAIAIVFILGAGLYGAVGGFVVSSAFSALLAIYLIRKLFLEIASKSGYTLQIKKLLAYSLPIIGVIFCYYLLFRLDRVMLGVFRSPYEVGIYSAASNIAMFMMVFSSVLEPGILPAISQLYHGNESQELKRIFNCVALWGVCFAFIPCIALMIFNQEILSLFGADFKIGGWVIIILCLSFFIEAVPGQMRQLLQMTSKQNIEFINSFIMVIVNIIFNLILIPRFGMIGAALSVMLSLLVVSLARVIETKIIFRFTPFTLRYLRFLIFSIFAIIISLLFVIDKNIPIKIASTIIIMAGFIWLVFRFKSEEDMLIWNSIRAKFK